MGLRLLRKTKVLKTALWTVAVLSLLFIVYEEVTTAVRVQERNSLYFNLQLQHRPTPTPLIKQTAFENLRHLVSLIDQDDFAVNNPSAEILENIIQYIITRREDTEATVLQGITKMLNATIESQFLIGGQLDDVISVIHEGVEVGENYDVTLARVERVLREGTEYEEDVGDVISDRALGNILPRIDRTWRFHDLPFARDTMYKSSQCPTSLRNLEMTSSWFNGRFKEDVKLFMDKTDLEMESYRHLTEKFSLPFGYRRENKTWVEQILNAIRSPDVFGGVRKKCVRCAVVGSGGQMKGSGKGKEIDAHDYVFRVNNAHTEEKYLADVGNRTSFYVFYPESQKIRHVAKANPLRLYVPFKAWDLMYLAGWLTTGSVPGGKGCKAKNLNTCEWHTRGPDLNSTNVKIVHPDFLRYIYANFLNATGLRPTTGAMTAFLAIQLCDYVGLYGYGYDPRFTLHYYDKTKFNASRPWRGACHDFNNERELWKRLSEEKVVYWFKRD
uniref:alpha-N-acetylgalactosaminide alpha-2,6-sialyltransferase n=2 Tax=Branchiostoma floridae TaxID=7739 RepID=C4A0N7_BRAFL|eukprot:XP_002585630.1 hypothetical protein BRAFLDRAFT_111640 [Branchiostoma floridae]